MWTSIILAGGESRRMGRAKALLPLGSATLIQHIVHVVRPFSKQTIVIARYEEKETIKALFVDDPHLLVIEDEPSFKGKGPLAGMQAGMKRLDSTYYFVSACDLPYLDQAYLRGLQQLITAKSDYLAYLPISEGRYQPFAAVYKNVVREVEQVLLSGTYRWTALLERLQNFYVIDENEWGKWTNQSIPFFNMNTLEDYKRIRSGWV